MALPPHAQKWTLLADAVPESSAARERTIRTLARRFTAREDRLGVKAELRLLPRPLYVYADEDRPALDGALFAFVYGTDPELLMQIEAQKKPAGLQWQVAFASLASAELTVGLDEKQVWSAPAIPERQLTDLTTGYCIFREDK